MIKKELIEILACPACKSGIRYENDKIVCDKCKRYYPVKNGIPVMLIEESAECK